MQMNRRNALAAFAAAAVPGAWAQDRYPSRPIRIIVTNAAGEVVSGAKSLWKKVKGLF